MLGIGESREVYVWLVMGIVIPTAGRTLGSLFRRLIWTRLTNRICGGDPCKACFKTSDEYSQLPDGSQKKILPDAVNVEWIWGYTGAIKIPEERVVISREKSSSIQTENTTTGWSFWSLFSFTNTHSEEITDPEEPIEIIQEDPYLKNLVKNPTWDNARKLLGWSWNLAISVSLLRLFFWHLMQPFAYCWTLYSYYNEIDHLQRVLALFVAFREVSYLFLTMICVRNCPRFLLTNIAAGWKSGNIGLTQRLINILFYGLSPEKFLLQCIRHSEFIPLLWLCDACGIMALIAGLMRGVLPIPLAISYGFTGLAGLWQFFFGIIIPVMSIEFIRKIPCAYNILFCCCKDMSFWDPNFITLCWLYSTCFCIIIPIVVVIILVEFHVGES